VAQPLASRRTRVALGVLILIAALGVTWMRASVAQDALHTLTDVTRLHREGQTTDRILANATYHAAHAQRTVDNRWTLTGYATHGVIGSALGLALLLVRRRRGTV
jgi:hypothetical protein